MNMERFRDELSRWIQEKVLAAGARGTVVGISGGVDSAVVAALCQRAFPETNLGVILPCDSEALDVQYARLLAERIGVRTVTIDLTETWRNLVALVETAASDAPAETIRWARVNVKPRLRMTVLYQIAARYNYLVVGTENRAEIAVGYSTKFGDAAADLMPIGNLVKREVRALAEVLGVPREIIDRTPTAGLWAGQTDEEEMGVTYDELDEWLLTGRVAPDVRARLETLHNRSAHKRSMPPLGPEPPR